MENKYLIINGGSSSLKFSIYSEDEKVLASGSIERIGSPECNITLKFNDQKIKKDIYVSNHEEALNQLISDLMSNNIILNINEIKGIGHRILHGGEFYNDSVLIDDGVIKNIESIEKLGPLHLPGELSCVKSCQLMLPGIPQIAVFDTAFHQTIPKENYMYAVPYTWYTENKVRKYGFHGTSHKYITNKKQEQLGREDVNLIVCHLGNGSSITAIKDGKSFDTTMGLTPLDGIVMGTRCGSIDPSIIKYICETRELTVDQVTDDLNNASGLTGIYGTNDLRDIEPAAENNDELATLSINMLVKSILEKIMAYYGELETKVDSIVFTGGIGENSPIIRNKVVSKLAKSLPISYNPDFNKQIGRHEPYKEGPLTNEDSKIKVEVIPTNEESVILKDTKKIIKSKDNELKLVRK